MSKMASCGSNIGYQDGLWFNQEDQDARTEATSLKMGGGPRSTKIIPADTMDLQDAWEIRDNWRIEGNCDAPFLSWCGTTVFAFRGHDIGDDPSWGDFRGSGIEPGPGNPEGDPRPEDESEGDGEGDSGRDEAEIDEGTAPDAQDEGDGGVCDAGGQEVRGSSEED